MGANREEDEVSDSRVLEELTTHSSPSREQIGGKGVGLLQLYELGLQVPPAWVIPAETYLSFLASLNLQPQLEELEDALGSVPLREMLMAIQEVILSAPLPGEILNQVHRLRRQCAEALGGGMIVRSSATVEDSERRSFAGIFESLPCYSNQEVEH